tara:strand:+ start:3861 stop:4061 length:201 start_codon:yes stop_codon:yes gene_type:complete
MTLKFIPGLEHTEEVDAKTVELHDLVETNITDMGVELTKEQSDKIFDAIHEVLMDFSETGDYRNYN